MRKALDGYRFNDAASAVYQFLWHEFCDWYLEIAKRSLYQTEDPVARAVTQQTLVETLEDDAAAPAPVHAVHHRGDLAAAAARRATSIMIAPFPRAAGAAATRAAERQMAPVIDVVSAIRTIRSESRISPATELTVTVKPARGGCRAASRERRR